jgi:sulfide:quinone oxidoreductase
MYTAHSDNVGVQTFVPDENALVMTNGRRIEYNYLVVAMGLKHDFD